MHILITGGSGMVGRNLLEHPGISTHTVSAPTHQDLDLLDASSTATYLAETEPQLVVHCAGVVGGIHANMREPVRFLVENFEMGKNLVLAARAARVTRLLNLGSSCMYPHTAGGTLAEEQILAGPLEPTNEGYALAKIGIERLCEYVTRETPSCQYKTLVPCNLYGRWDTFALEYSHMIPAALRKVHEATVSGNTSVGIWGDGEARREFMYASDLADFITYAIDRFDDLPQRMNVGPGTDYSINEYYRAIAEVVGFDGQFMHDLDKPVGMARKLLDVSLMKGFGWSPPTNLTAGIQQTYDFFLQHASDQ